MEAGQNQKTCKRSQDTENGLRSSNFCQRYTTCEKGLSFICCILIIISITLILLLTLHDEIKKKKVCMTLECIRAASSFAQRLDESVDPCQDMYQFSCGNYLKMKEVPDDHYFRSWIQEIQDDILVISKRLLEKPINTETDSGAVIKAKTLYESCMNKSSVEEDSVAILKTLLSPAGIGDWPLLSSRWHQHPKLTIEYRLAKLFSYEVQPFFHLYVRPDIHDASSFELQLWCPKSVFELEKYTEGNITQFFVTYQRAYGLLIRETARLLGAHRDIASKDAKAIIAFEAEFARRLLEDAYGNQENNETMDEHELMDAVSLQKLQEILPMLNWTKFLTHVFEHVDVKQPVDVTNFTIMVQCHHFFTQLQELLKNTPPRTVANYLSWQFLYKYIPYLDIHFRRLYFDFRREIPDLSTDRMFTTRWKECVAAVGDGFSMVLAAMFVKEEFYEDNENEIQGMVNDVKETFAEILLKEDWLDDQAKGAITNMVRAMGAKIGYPKYIKDPKLLDKDYAGLDITNDHFLINILKMNGYEVIKELMKLFRPVDEEKDWFIEPLVVNAFYAESGNDAIFPMGILRYPLFAANRPNYLNYGSLGIIIGHEVTHGLESSARRLDRGPNITLLWNEESLEIVKERAQCFVDQFSAYRIEPIGESVNGNHTLYENICDYAGFQQAFLTYKKYLKENGEEDLLPGLEKYSNEQLFILQYSQVWCEVLSKEGGIHYLKDNHSPGRHRANGVLQNSDYFAEAFQCPLGSPMNPVNKCRMWG